MNARRLTFSELPPEARLERAKRLLAEAVGEMVEAYVAKGTAASEWVSQDDSPLGKRRHLELVRAGTLPAVRDGRLRLVRREELNRYLEANGRTSTNVPIEDDVAAMMRSIEGGHRE